MKKIPCLFVREFDGPQVARITAEITAGCEWVADRDAIPTIKHDGTACMVQGGVLYKRYDAKVDQRTGKYKIPPTGAIPCSEPDPITGHWPHWIAVGQGPEDKWHLQAWKDVSGSLRDGTYELCGPNINGNPYPLARMVWFRHGVRAYDFKREDLSFDGIRQWLAEHEEEGLVFHHPDGRMAKIRRVDFDLEWPIRQKSAAIVVER